MLEHYRKLLDRKIGRRTFVSRLAQAGVSLAGANAIADSLAAEPVMPGLPEGDRPPPGRMVSGLTGGEVMVEFLSDWNIPYLFGLAGSEEVGLLDALVDRPQVQYTTAIHENAVMAMADGYSRATGNTSVVQLHSVAGVAYALGQIVGSFRDRVPVVVTAGRQSTDFRGQDGFLESPNLAQLPRDYTQWIWDVMHVGTIPEVLRRAFLFAEAPPGGPSFVTFSKDLWEQRVAQVEILPRTRSRVEYSVPPPAGHAAKIVAALSAARRPCIYLGNECTRFEVSDTVARIAEHTGAMVMLSTKIACVFPTTHPNFVGEVLDDPALMQEVDCFWSIGGQVFKTFTRPANPILPRSAVAIHTSLASADVGRNYPVDIAAIASIDATAQEVLDLLQAGGAVDGAQEKNAWLHAYTARLRQGHSDAAQAEWDATPIATSRLMIELDRVMAADAEIVFELITSDSYPRKYLRFDHQVPAAQRRRSYLTTSGVLGWGVAAAIGVKIGKPRKETWCLTGDGCFNFGSQALWSARRYEVPVGIVIFNNREYQANRMIQHVYEGRIAQSGQYYGVKLDRPDIDYVQMAGAYDVAGERVDRPADIAGALQRCKAAMQAGRPYVVDVRIEKRGPGSDSPFYDEYSVAAQAGA